MLEFYKNLIKKMARKAGIRVVIGNQEYIDSVSGLRGEGHRFSLRGKEVLKVCYDSNWHVTWDSGYDDEDEGSKVYHQYPILVRTKKKNLLLRGRSVTIAKVESGMVSSLKVDSGVEIFYSFFRESPKGKKIEVPIAIFHVNSSTLHLYWLALWEGRGDELRKIVTTLLEGMIKKVVKKLPKSPKVSPKEKAITNDQAMKKMLEEVALVAMNSEKGNLDYYMRDSKEHLRHYRELRRKAKKAKEVIVSAEAMTENAQYAKKVIKTLLSVPAIKAVDFWDKRLYITTNPITLRIKIPEIELFEIGRFEINLDFFNHTLFIFNLDNPRGYEYDHPHIKWGSPCFGNISSKVSTLLDKGEILSLVLLIIEYLGSYRQEGAFKHIYPWMEGMGKKIRKVSTRKKKPASSRSSIPSFLTGAEIRRAVRNLQRGGNSTTIPSLASTTREAMRVREAERRSRARTGAREAQIISGATIPTPSPLPPQR